MPLSLPFQKLSNRVWGEVLTGTIINVLAIIAGGLLGWKAGALFPEKIRGTLLVTLGLVVFVLGVEMVLDWVNPLHVIIALVLGGVLGEFMKIEEGLAALGDKLQKSLGSHLKGDLASGFVFTTLIYCVGPMAVLGAMESGLRGTHGILLAKASIDGLTAIAFASTLGLGVVFSSLSVLLYQGLLTLGFGALGEVLASADEVMIEQIIAQLTATGGILIMGIGLKIMEIRQLRVANLLPALPVVVIIYLLQFFI